MSRPLRGKSRATGAAQRCNVRRTAMKINPWFIIFSFLCFSRCAIRSEIITTKNTSCKVTPESLAKVSYHQNENDSCAPYAIIIRDVPCSEIGIAAEFQWLEEHYPGYKWIEHSLISEVVGSSCGHRSYCRFKIVLSSGEEKTITFDDSEYRGK